MTKKNSYSRAKQQIVLAELRRHRMLELRVAGYTEREIADELEVSQTLVHQGIKKELAEQGSSAGEIADEVRRLEMARYTSLVNKWWDKASSDAEAARIVLKTCSQIDKIHGIIPDKPLIDMRNQTIVNSGLEIMTKLKELGSNEARLREEITQKVRKDVQKERPAAEPKPETTQDVRKIIENKKIPAPAPAPKELKQKATKKITVNRRW